MRRMLPIRTRPSKRRSSSVTSCSARSSTRSTASAPTSAAASASPASLAPTSKGATEWFSHTPVRVTGPNAQGCFECHEQPFEDGSGTAAQNVHRDPFRTGQVGQFVERNTPHVFAPGAIQRLAEEMTDGLTADQNRLVNETCSQGGTRSVNLTTKGVNFGTLVATRTRSNPCAVTFNTDGVRGVDFQPSVDNPAAAAGADRQAVPVERQRRPSSATSTAAPATTSSGCRRWRSSATTSTAISTASGTSSRSAT